MWQLQVFQEQENTVKAGALFLTPKGSWEHRQAPRASLGALWGKSFSVAEEGIPSLSTWLPATCGDGWGLPWGIGRKVGLEVETETMHSWCYLGLRCFAKQMKGRNKCTIRADHQFLVKGSIQLQLFFPHAPAGKCKMVGHLPLKQTQDLLLYQKKQAHHTTALVLPQCKHKILSFSSLTSEQGHK